MFTNKYMSIRVQTAVIALLVSALVAGTASYGAVSSSDHTAKPSKAKTIRGKRGPRGLRGLTGPTGASTSLTEVSWRGGDQSHIPANTSKAFETECPPGMVAIDAGYIMGSDARIIGFERLSIHSADYRQGYRLTVFADGSDEWAQLRIYCGRI